MTVLPHGVVPLFGWVTETIVLAVVLLISVTVIATLILGKRRQGFVGKSTIRTQHVPRGDRIPRASTEKRRSSRHLLTPVIVLVSETPTPTDSIEGLILNSSPDGLGLSLKQKLSVDTVVQVRVATAPAETPWVQVKVKHCSPMASRWRVGCQYVEPPPPDVLVLFG
jgi:hypothetical protein